MESHTSSWTTTQYDALSRVNLAILPDSSTVQTTYEGVYTTITDQAGRKRRHLADALGRVTRVDEPDASGNLGPVTAPTQPTYYEYNTTGKTVHVAQNAQHRYFRYDALDRLTHERQVEPLATPFTTNDAQRATNPTTNTVWTVKLVYDETLFGVNYKGLLTAMYDARNILTQTLYDNLNRPITISYSDGVSATIDNYYDNQAFTVSGDARPVLNIGRLSEVRTAAIGSVPATAQLSNFDAMGRIIQSRQTVGGNIYTFSYAYNAGGSLTSQTYPSGRVVNFSYDDAARLSQVSSGATTYANQFGYGTHGLLTSVTFGNGAVQSFGYNSRLQLNSIDLTRAGTQIQHYDYKYGVYDPVANTLDETKNNGQVAQIEGLIGNVKQWQQRFTYDSLRRLATAREKRGDNNQQSYLIQYDYDIYGNRFQYQAQNGGNPFPQAWVEAGQISAANNRFTSGLTYDNAGNITQDTRFRSKQFAYDANNRQRWSANLDGSGAVTTVFDGAGQRLATMVNNEITTISVYDANGNLAAEYGQSTQNGTQYLMSDQQGSPRAVTSAAGSVISRHDYLPFGEELNAGVGMRTSGLGYGGVDGIQKKYVGMETDTATGMAHTLWRKYDQLSGRWTTTDPFGGSMTVEDPQTFNRYAYVSNDPVNSIDPTGLMLSDIGVYQTNDAGQARMAEQMAFRNFQLAINEQYIRSHQQPARATPGIIHELGHSGLGEQSSSQDETTAKRKVLDHDLSIVQMETPELLTEGKYDVIVNVTGWNPHPPANVDNNCRIRAMLDTIAFAEGADYGTVVRGRVIRAPYNPELVGRTNVTITDFSRHPNILVQVRPGLASTAAGRYQFLSRTWATLNQTDFTAPSQDRGAVILMRRRGMIEPLLAGDTETAIRNGNREWASLPGSPYGQGTRSMGRLVNVFNNALGRCTQ